MAVKEGLLARGKHISLTRSFPPNDHSLYVDPGHPPTKCRFHKFVLCLGPFGRLLVLSAVVLTDVSRILKVVITQDYNEGIYTIRFCIQHSVSLYASALDIINCFLSFGSDVHVSSSGIVQGHAYSVLQVREGGWLQTCSNSNPWANEVEWNGPWSDSSPEWTDHETQTEACSPGKRWNFGCLGKIFRFTSVQYIFVVFILLKCGTLFMGNGVAMVRWLPGL
ncbi:hypothetical protein HPP92_024358 [Vanilla planifolia]|uniref:Calpain catalytic domain-containing protein n=1 Tax=Vanilla planifolia TaxID=51239 RepID=A0A835PQ52_VANPL|nr:hypothetical protein HPP92_024358 [Vanilla planifolia]